MAGVNLCDTGDESKIKMLKTLCQWFVQKVLVPYQKALWSIHHYWLIIWLLSPLPPTPSLVPLTNLAACVISRRLIVLSSLQDHNFKINLFAKSRKTRTARALGSSACKFGVIEPIRAILLVHINLLRYHGFYFTLIEKGFKGSYDKELIERRGKYRV